MLELTKVSTTTGLTDFHFSVPNAEVPWIEKLLKTALKSIETQESEENAEKDSYSIEEVFGTIAPGEVLQGYRFRDELTQKQVAEAVGVKQHHISDMERGHRKISRKMATRFAVLFKTKPEVFL